MSASSWYSKVWSSAGGSLDRVYAQVINSLHTFRFFAKGWGDISHLNPDKLHRILMKLEEQPVMHIDWKLLQHGVHRGTAFQLFEGSFLSPGTLGVPNLPEKCKRGRVWLMRPTGKGVSQWPSGMRGCVVQLAATGEHRQERVLLSKSLLPSGIGSLILESPFYGARKPPGQRGSKLLYVADLIKLGATTILESVCLIWMLRNAGVPNICVAGWSMGAIHACMVASLTRFPVATAATMPPRCASTAYCDGALSDFVELSALRSGRDSLGEPILCTVSRLFSQRANYPNTPKLFQRLNCEDFTGGSAAESGQAGVSSKPVAAGFSSTDVHAWKPQYTEELQWPANSEDLRPQLPVFEDMHAEQASPSNKSSTLLDTIPAAPALTPHLQRFLSALSTLTMPLWRAQRSMRSTPHSSTSRRGRGTRNAPPLRRRKRALPFASLVSPQAARAQLAKATARSPGKAERRMLFQLRNVLTALQKMARLRVGRESKVLMRHRRQNPAPETAPHVAPQTPPPCAAIHRTSAGGTFRNTLQQLLVAEIQQHHDASFFARVSHAGDSHAAPHSHEHPLSPPSVPPNTSQPLIGAHLNDANDAPARPLEKGVSAPTSSNRNTPRTHTNLPATEHSNGEPSQRAQAATRRPSSASTEALNGHPISDATDSHAGSGCPTSASTEASSGRLISDAPGAASGGYQPPQWMAAEPDVETPSGDERRLPSVAAFQKAIIRSMVQAAGVVTTRLPPLTPLTRGSNAAHRSSTARKRAKDVPTLPRSEVPDPSVDSQTRHRVDLRNHKGPQGSQGSQGPNLSAARYSQMLKKVVSGEYLLGESDELHSDDEGEREQHRSRGGATSVDDNMKMGDAGCELLLAITLEAFTDLCRYPRPQAPQAAVLVAAQHDYYVAPHAVEAIHEHWPGSQLWHASGGHVSSFITLNSTFLRAVKMSLSQLDTWNSTPAYVQRGQEQQVQEIQSKVDVKELSEFEPRT